MKFNSFVTRAAVALVLCGLLGGACWSPRLAPVTVQVDAPGRRVHVGKFVAKGEVSREKVRTLRRSVVRSLKASGFKVQRGREQAQIAVVVDHFRDVHYPLPYSERQFLTALLTLGMVIPIQERHSLGEIRVILYATLPDGQVVRRVFAAWSSARCRIGLVMWGLPVITAYCRLVYERAQKRLTREILEALRQLIDRRHPKAIAGSVKP